MNKEVGFGIVPDWKKHWKGMPLFEQEDQTPLQSLVVHFRSPDDRKEFGKLLGRNLTNKTRSIWFPKEDIRRCSDKCYASEDLLSPRYPVYVISKGRWETRLTSKALEVIGVPYFIVIEPQEYRNYTRVIDPKKILKLPFSNLGKGSIPARNWVWKHSLENGDNRHWILDDNLRCFYRLTDNLKVPVSCGNIFRAAEDFTDRYKNVGLSGFNYFMFAKRKMEIPAYYLNTRIYSCILIRNNIPFRWRGKYNEDTDLSLRVLKAKWCTILFNAFLVEKMQTMTMKGGNTEELYRDDGRLDMAKSLKEQHPNLVKVTRKWGRWQHHVNYKPFRKNRLKLRDTAVIPEGIDNFGMYLKYLEELEE